MGNYSFLFVSTVITFAFLQAFSFFRFHFSGLENYKAQVKTLKKDLKEEKLRIEILGYEMTDFKQSVAEVIPKVHHKKLNLDHSYQTRRLASLVSRPQFQNLELSSSLFEEGKGLFRKKKYEAALKKLKRVVEDYPFSKHRLEAYFLIAESQYLLNEYNPCLDSIDLMLTHFPSSELTGYILLRMGHIFERKERSEDAAEVYRTVIRSFKDPGLKRQAKLLLRPLEL